MTLIPYMKAYFVLFLLILVSCGEEEKPDNGWDVDNGSDFQQIEQLFEGDKFENPDHLMLLEELDICNMNLNDSTSTVAKCSPDNFKIEAISTEKEVKNAFLLYTASEIQLRGHPLPLPIRHIMVFERENGKLIRTNGFRGELVETRNSKGPYKDLLIAYYVKRDDTVFLCLYKWRNGKYSFERVEGLDWGEGMKPLKPELQDSMNTDIHNTIMESKLEFGQSFD